MPERKDETTPRERAMLDSALDCIVAMDSQGRVTEFNPAAERVFGYTAEEAIGQSMGELIVPPSLREAHHEGLSRNVSGAAPRILDQRVEIVGMRADGTLIPIELTITRIAGTDPPEYTGYLRDITERVESKEQQRSLERRLVSASDSARRQLARDLHDGAQQRLIAVAMNLQFTRSQLSEDQADLLQELSNASDELLAAVDELRELARGIHPSILSENGLEAAIEVLGRRSSLPVEITYDAPKAPQLTEATAYFVASEAFANIARHSGASKVMVSVHVAGDELHLKISDDGDGGASAQPGGGLAGLDDRVRAIGGSMALSSPPGEGTTLEAFLPCE